MPVSTGEAVSGNKAADVKDIFIGLWPILTIILMVVLLKMPIYAAVATTVVFAVGYYLIWNLL